LNSYFSYLGENPDARIVHWNMNKSDYGFRAIATRYTYLTGAPAPNGHAADRLYDLGSLVAARYGDEYADHPKLYNLGKLNRFATTHILDGKEEAERLKVTDEHDAQDLYHALLRIFFADVRQEEWTPSYAGSSARIDFLLPEHGLAIELKHARKSMTKKTLGDELTVDVGH
jgi:hypothetical protein